VRAVRAPSRPEIRAEREAWRALARRPEVRASIDAAKELGVPVRIVGGAVRDAFLRRPHADLDLTATVGSGRRVAEAIARRLGTKVVEIGAEGRRIARVPWHERELDVWEAADPLQDLLRRDFRVNALAFELPEGRLVALEGALEDLAKRRLSPPRAGVFLEDPLRVLRAARLELTLGFRVDPRALTELKKAAALLPRVAAERTHAEMELLLAAEPRRALRALLELERWGALARLLPRTSAAERREGIRLVGRAPKPDPQLARILLVAPLGRDRALLALEAWKVSRTTLRAARTLLELSRSATRRPPTTRELVLFLRSAAPFQEHAIAFLAAAGDAPARRLASAAHAFAPTPAARRRVVAPKRPLGAREVARLLGIAEGPDLGRALVELDVALAAREIRGKRDARRFLRARRRV
jgi:tRNA nucleotidyltransferase/poly(A) polymerase